MERYHGEIIGTYISEMRAFHTYKLNYKDREICIVQAVVGSGSYCNDDGLAIRRRR